MANIGPTRDDLKAKINMLKDIQGDINKALLLCQELLESSTQRGAVVREVDLDAIMTEVQNVAYIKEN